VLALALIVPASGRLLTANAAPSLPGRTAAQLLADLQTARVDGMSGTVVQHSNLGLPQLPGVTTGGSGGSGSSSLTSLISGTHTMRVWYSGPDKARLALLGTLGESDVIVNQRDVWIWSSDQKTAQHRLLPAGTKEQAPAEAPLGPQAAADRALAAITPTTVVTTGAPTTVAGRPAYELVLAPRDTRSLVHEVRIALDSTTHVPLRVQALAKGHQDPAFDVGFTQVSFQRPDDAQFHFTPPPGTTVTEVPAPAGKAGTSGHPDAKTGKDAKTGQDAKTGKAETPPAAGAAQPEIIGTGWTAVVVAKTGSAGTSPDIARIVESLPRVSGSWGSGRLLRSTLASVLITDDGRILAGAVAPELLYAAAQ
jgi:outer membrane lipoprotein-sorting protein